MTWLEEARRASVADVARELGREVVSAGIAGPCPCCGAERRGGEKTPRPPVGIRRDRLGWRCHLCEARGDGPALAAAVLLGTPKPDRAGWGTVRDWYAARGWCEARTAPGEAPRPRPAPVPLASPVEPPRPPPPAEEVAHLWSHAGRADLEASPPSPATWLRRRLARGGDGAAPEVLAALELARVLPKPTEAEPLPRWARFAGLDWYAGGYRLISPMFNAAGALASLRARWTGAPGADLEASPPPSPKSAAPAGYSLAGMALACRVGRWLLSRGPDARPGDLPAPEAPAVRWSGLVAVVEGEPALWHAADPRRARRAADGGLDLPAVLGVVAGSWTAELAARIPTGARVLVATDLDRAGQSYAARIAATLTDRCQVRRMRRPEGKDGKGLGDLGLSTDEAWEGGAPMNDDPNPLPEMASDGPNPLEMPNDGRFGGEEEEDPAITKARAMLAPWTVAEAGQRLVSRLERVAAGQAGYPWPGCGAEPERSAERKAAPGALLPRDDGHRPADWKELHRKIGPLYADDLVVLVGPTGRGKTGWAVTLAENVATARRPVLYMSCELGIDELAARFLAMRQRAEGRASIGWASILRGAVELPDVIGAIQRLEADCPALYLWAPASKKRNPRALRAMVKALADYHGGAAPLVVVDYLQRLSAAADKGDKGDKGTDDRRAGVAAASGELRAVSRPDGPDGYPGAAVVALSSTARANYEHFTDANALRVAFKGGFKPAEGQKQDALRWSPPVELVGMGKESGEIEYDASLVLCLTCDKLASLGLVAPGVLVVSKARAGTPCEVGLSFDGARGLWTDAELPPMLEQAKTSATSPPGAKLPPGIL